MVKVKIKNLTNRQMTQSNEGISHRFNAVIKKIALYAVISSLLSLKRSGAPLHVIFLALVTMPCYSVKTRLAIRQSSVHAS